MPLGIIKKACILGMGTILYHELRSKFHKHFFFLVLLLLFLLLFHFAKLSYTKLNICQFSIRFNILQFDNDTKYIRQRRMRGHLVGLYVRFLC